MNKYQEALDYLISNGTHTTVYSWGDEIEVETERGEESVNLLLELVDKVTPLKPRYAYLDKIELGVYGCPKCDLIINHKCNYCLECGQK